ncbi:MAG: hypothetical protein EOO88_10055 [Pedobacter sp.]|nr:MAG: hypothetical protein EOO88_10055 [Pedobacter sp.]
MKSSQAFSAENGLNARTKRFDYFTRPESNMWFMRLFPAGEAFPEDGSPEGSTQSVFHKNIGILSVPDSKGLLKEMKISGKCVRQGCPVCFKEDETIVGEEEM